MKPAKHGLVSLAGISRIYGSGGSLTNALQDVSLTVEAGEFTCIWGPSGSGKSTLLNLIGLLDRPNRGELTIAGVDCSSLDEKAAANFRNERLGFVFQGFNLVPVLTAVENVMLPAQVAGKSTKVAQETAMAILGDMGLAQQAKKWPDQMSGGQRQRVAIARALVNAPELVLADEPTANLDSATAESIIDLLRRLNQERKVTFLFSTHDSRLLNYAFRLIELRDGRIESDELSSFQQRRAA